MTTITATPSPRHLLRRGVATVLPAAQVAGWFGFSSEHQLRAVLATEAPAALCPSGEVDISKLL